MAIDKSGSMSGARMEAAKEGASMVINELSDGDLAAVKVFNDKVKDLSDGVTQIDPETKRTLCSKIQSITADGMTSLYDVTLASGLEIMQTSAAVKAFGGRKSTFIKFHYSMMNSSTDNFSKCPVL
jgi:Ca-activated chloride channel family protein